MGSLGKTTGWIHRAALDKRNVKKVTGVEYDLIDDAGMHVTLADGSKQVFACDSVVICAGQDEERTLRDILYEAHGIKAFEDVQLLGGADLAAELDAERAIRQATEVAIKIGIDG